jgi:hypothetical protein
VSMKENHKSLRFCLAVDRYKSDMNFRGYVWQSSNIWRMLSSAMRYRLAW